MANHFWNSPQYLLPDSFSLKGGAPFGCPTYFLKSEDHFYRGVKGNDDPLEKVVDLVHDVDNHLWAQIVKSFPEPFDPCNATTPGWNMCLRILSRSFRRKPERSAQKAVSSLLTMSLRASLGSGSEGYLRGRSGTNTHVLDINRLSRGSCA